jgi:hypothetical protein
VRLRLLPGAFALCRLTDPAAPVLPALPASFWSLTVTAGERSLVCPEEDAPADGTVVRGYRVLEVAGPLDLGLTGIMASLAVPLAEAGVPILPIGTHDTDYLLVPGAQLDPAVAALRAAGYTVA